VLIGVLGVDFGGGNLIEGVAGDLL
jgi:hypothetical protein